MEYLYEEYDREQYFLEMEKEYKIKEELKVINHAGKHYRINNNQIKKEFLGFGKLFRNFSNTFRGK